MNHQLLRYLKHVKELETTIYTQDLLINKLTKYANNLGQKKNIEKRTRYVSTWFELHSWIIPTICVIIFFLLLKPLYNIFWDISADAYIADSGNYYFGKNAADRTIETSIITFCVDLFISGITFLIFKIIEIINKSKLQKRLDKEANYEWNQKLIADNNRINHELQIRSQVFKQVDLIKKQKRSTEQELMKYYNLNIIYNSPKYRNMIAVTSFCEYIESGKCSRLDGHEGAYNIYDIESRLDKIITEVRSAM